MAEHSSTTSSTATILRATRALSIDLADGDCLVTRKPEDRRWEMRDATLWRSSVAGGVCPGGSLAIDGREALSWIVNPFVGLKVV